jgi:hypothetical protein
MDGVQVLATMLDPYRIENRPFASQNDLKD